MADDAHSGLTPRAPAPGMLTPGEGRRFALTVAAGFVALGVVAMLRSHPASARILLALAATFAVLALVVPTRLAPVRAAWMALGVALSRITAPVFYALVYWVLLTPTGIVRRTLGRSPLWRDARATSYWVAREPMDDEAGRRRLERQF